jgi:hypothetical protein
MGKKQQANPRRQAKFKDMAAKNQAHKNKEKRWNQWFARMTKKAEAAGREFNPKYKTFAAWHEASTKAGKAGFEKSRQLEAQRRAADRKGFKRPVDAED